MPSNNSKYNEEIREITVRHITFNNHFKVHSNIFLADLKS